MTLGDGRRRFCDFTKIRDVSAALQDHSALRRDNVSDNSISKTAENSNAQKNFSLKNVGTDKAEQRRRQGAGSRGAKHTPFAAEATAAGYEDVALKVTGFQGNKHVLERVITANPLWLASRCGQVERETV